MNQPSKRFYLISQIRNYLRSLELVRTFTLFSLSILSGLSIFCVAANIPPKNLAADELVIKNITLISPERHTALENAYVRIVNGEIKEVSTKPIISPNNAAQIDGTGKYLTPGLMDSHVHVSRMPGIVFKGKDPTKLLQLQNSFLAQQPRSYLYFGVTQLLDPSQSKQSIVTFNSSLQKPKLFHCGAAPILGGYPTVWIDKHEAPKVFDYIILDQDTAQSLPENIDLAQHTPEAVVRRMAEDGAICVKVFIEDGFGTDKNWPLISEGLLLRVKKAAKKHGLIMLAHANAIDMQKIALQLEVDAIAHGMWNWNQYDGHKGLPIEIREILDGVIEQNIIFQPTFNVMDGLKGVTVPGVLNEPLYQKVVSKAALDWYHSKEGLWFRDEMVNGFGDLPLEKIHRRQDIVISQGERVVQYLDGQNYPLVLASDTPSSPTFAAQPGYSTFAELKHLHKVGVSLQRIFEAATINNAKAFKLDKSYGTVEPGKVANLLILDESPLKTIEAYNAIDKVIVNGEVIERESLAVGNSKHQ
ncbi:amidohydrolase family protein [Aliikangiella coralliicola]|uniref:Amidohydrolase family protein n=1 Tax=Aliikangiella coralliicola TaxID=2592383 RepID=A0A545UEM5_9GAMM|nr:amidohydrolase family protein [Aliikangiella coralliicola]TQV87926.1 amidohydrolase family protein [Aliikangiella coralliicola]